MNTIKELYLQGSLNLTAYKKMLANYRIDKRALQHCYSFNTDARLNEILQPLKEILQLTGFVHTRLYPFSGKMFSLTNRHLWKQYYIKHQLGRYWDVRPIYNPFKDNYGLLDALPTTTLAYKKIIKPAAQHFNLAHGAYLTKVNATSIDTFVFYGANDDHQFLPALIENISHFQHFLYYYLDEAQNLISYAKANLIHSIKYANSVEMDISTQHPINFKQKDINLLPEKIYIDAKGTYLTEREAQVLSHTLQKRTCKAIARKLQLSPRTIEFHLNNIKRKFQVQKKSALIDYAKNNHIESLLASSIEK